jgi:hypothetical protein
VSPDLYWYLVRCGWWSVVVPARNHYDALKIADGLLWRTEYANGVDSIVSSRSPWSVQDYGSSKYYNDLVKSGDVMSLIRCNHSHMLKATTMNDEQPTVQ